MTDEADWLRQMQRDLLPMIEASNCVATIGPGDHPDAKVAVELGFALLLDKPLVMIRMPDRAIPERLARAADAVIDWSDDSEEMKRRMADALALLDRMD